MRIQGYATKEGTKEYFKKNGINAELLRDSGYFYNLPIAIGTHLGNFSDEDSNSYRDAVYSALSKGINFIDTAINYRGMRSERDIGIALDRIINKEKKIKREEVIIATKAGIIPGDIEIMLKPVDYLKEKLVDKNILRYEDLSIVKHLKHTLKPKFFEFAIENSLKHLNINTIDIHYLHNPELSMQVIGEKEFYDKLAKLFEFYEDQVDKGNIRYYGLATWDAFLVDKSDKRYISLDKVASIAKSVRMDNHLKFIQLPFNIKRNEAINLKNQKVNGKDLTIIDAARELGIKVNVSGPLAQGELFESGVTASELLDYAANTKGIYSAMVGMKDIRHVDMNLKFIINEEL